MIQNEEVTLLSFTAWLQSWLQSRSVLLSCRFRLWKMDRRTAGHATAKSSGRQRNSQPIHVQKHGVKSHKQKTLDSTLKHRHWSNMIFSTGLHPPCKPALSLQDPKIKSLKDLSSRNPNRHHSGEGVAERASAAPALAGPVRPVAGPVRPVAGLVAGPVAGPVWGSAQQEQHWQVEKLTVQTAQC